MKPRLVTLILLLLIVGLLVIAVPFRHAAERTRRTKTIADLETGMTVIVTHEPGPETSVRRATQVAEIIVSETVPGPNQVQGKLKLIDPAKKLIEVSVPRPENKTVELLFAVGDFTVVSIGAEPEVTQLSDLGAATILLMGGFRGLAVDVLWLRSISLHEQRRYHEERALLDIISNLQPQYASVWVFQAWNISYNISVQYNSVDEQFKWVTEGRNFLLKGEEILPESADIAFWLGILYSHKYGYDPAYGELLEKEEHKNNYEEGAYWFDRCRKLIWEGRPLAVFHPRVADSQVFQCCLSRYQQILQQGPAGPEGFSPDALKRAQPWRDRCLQEAAGLNRRWPDDAVFPEFAARVDTVPVDAYIFYAKKTILDGGLTEKAEAGARIYLDLAQKALVEAASRHKGRLEQAALLHAYQRIERCLFEAYFNRAREIIAGQANPPVDKVREAVRWLNRARTLVESVKSSKEEAEQINMDIDRLLKRAGEILNPVPPAGTSPK